MFVFPPRAVLVLLLFLVVIGTHSKPGNAATIETIPAGLGSGGTTVKAYTYGSASNGTTNNFGVEYDASNYVSVNTSNDVRAFVAGTTVFRAHRYNFTLNSSTNLNWMTFTVESRIQNTGCDEGEAIYVWNWTNNAWQFLNGVDLATTDATFTFNITGGFGDFVNTTNNQTLFKVHCHDSGNNNIHIDFAQLQYEYTTGNQYSLVASDIASAVDTASPREYAGERSASETAALADTAARSSVVSRNASETAALIDNQGKIFRGDKRISEVVVAIDANGRVTFSAREPSDVATIAESTGRTATVIRAGSSEFVVVDGHGRAFQGNRSAAEVVIATDSNARIVISVRDVSEIFVVADSAGRNVTVIRTGSSLLTVIDSNGRVWSGDRISASSFDGLDSVARDAIYSKLGSESAAAADTGERRAGYTRPATDQGLVADLVGRLSAIQRMASSVASWALSLTGTAPTTTTTTTPASSAGNGGDTTAQGPAIRDWYQTPEISRFVGVGQEVRDFVRLYNNGTVTISLNVSFAGADGQAYKYLVDGTNKVDSLQVSLSPGRERIVEFLVYTPDNFFGREMNLAIKAVFNGTRQKETKIRLKNQDTLGLLQIMDTPLLTVEYPLIGRLNGWSILTLLVILAVFMLFVGVVTNYDLEREIRRLLRARSKDKEGP